MGGTVLRPVDLCSIKKKKKNLAEHEQGSKPVSHFFMVFGSVPAQISFHDLDI